MRQRGKKLNQTDSSSNVNHNSTLCINSHTLKTESKSESKAAIAYRTGKIDGVWFDELIEKDFFYDEYERITGINIFDFVKKKLFSVSSKDEVKIS